MKVSAPTAPPDPAATPVERDAPPPARRLTWASPALLVVLALGLVVRMFETVAYSTVVTDYYTGDSARFMRFGFDGMFSDPWQPAAYPLFLRGVRELTDWLPVTVTLQHLMGLAMAALLYGTARRAGIGRALSLFPAAWVAFSADHLFLEQNLLTEPLWMLLIAGGLYAAVRAAQGRDLRWLAAAGAVLGLSAITRNVSLSLIAVLALWALIVWNGDGWRGRARAAALAAGPGVAIVLVYSLTATSIGDYSGLGDMRGWSLYQRVGQFADCSTFTPPDGTAGLCDSRPPAERPGPFYWYFDLDSPAREAFPAMSPEDDGQAGAFARAAIVNQPFDYLRAVTKDVVRYFDPHAGADRPLSGSDPSSMSFRFDSTDPALVEKVELQYDGFDESPDAATSVLETYGAVFRLNGLLLLALFVLSGVAVLRAPPRMRPAVVLCTVSAIVLLVAPPAVSSYDARYAIPPAALLTVPAAAGVAVLARRR